MTTHTSYLAALIHPGQKTVKTDCDLRVDVDRVSSMAIPARNHCKDCAHERALSFNALYDLYMNDKFTSPADRDKLSMLFTEAGIPIPEEV